MCYTKLVEWKIKRDSFYGPLYEKYGFKFVCDAGYFNDTATQDEDITKSLNILCTPLSFLKASGSNKKCVLLGTGAFSPLHCGHLEMMECAKETLESNGWDVLGGYLSPGHDEYIKIKTKDEWLSIHQRIYLAQDLINTTKLNWLAVDPWEGLFTKVAVNFTDVIERLTLYLKKHLDKDITVFYVCGGDNSYFINTFKEKGHCVVVGRPPYEEKFNWFKNHNPDSNRIFFVENDNPLSSSNIRKQKIELSIPKKNLYLRLSRNSANDSRVLNLMYRYFDNIELGFIEDQKIPKGSNKVVSLDPMLPGDYNLAVSRVYDLFGINLLGLGTRPYSIPLLWGMERLPEGTYDLFDDDICSGATIKYVKQTAKKFESFKFENILTLKKQNYNLEVLDARDFLLGLDDHSGLVIAYPRNKEN